MTSTVVLHYLTYAMGVLDAGAAIIYAGRRDWTLTVVWLCYAVAAIALGRVR